MGMILRIASSRIVGQGDIVGRSGYFSLNLSANSVMRGRLDARRTLKSLVADLRAVWYPMDRRTDKWQLYFSTDEMQDAKEVLDFYRTRFQLEFCFRDAKQHAGMTNCQATDFRKLAFHFNASLAAINLAKAACKKMGIKYSISSCKSVIHNAYMLERFICVSGIEPNTQLIDKLFKELILFTAKAA